MSKKLYVAAGALFLLIVVVMANKPAADICSDDVRGYHKAASSALDVARQNLSNVNASISTEISNVVPVQLDGLTATNFTAIKACDTQCKLLNQCLRLVFFRAPSQACPNEYKDYKEQTDAALALLSKLQGIAVASKEAEQKAVELSRRKKDAAEPQTPLGPGLRQLNERVAHTQRELSEKLSAVQQQISEVLRSQQGGT